MRPSSIAADDAPAPTDAIARAGWFVYVLLNAKSIAYTGIAKDVAARLRQHNAGKGAKFTQGRGPWRAIHCEGPMTLADALRRERVIKRDAAFKSALKAGDIKSGVT